MDRDGYLGLITGIIVGLVVTVILGLWTTGVINIFLD